MPERKDSSQGATTVSHLEMQDNINNTLYGLIKKNTQAIQTLYFFVDYLVEKEKLNVDEVNEYIAKKTEELVKEHQKAQETTQESPPSGEPKEEE